MTSTLTSSFDNRHFRRQLQNGHSFKALLPQISTAFIATLTAIHDPKKKHPTITEKLCVHILPVVHTFTQSLQEAIFWPSQHGTSIEKLDSITFLNDIV